MLTRMDRERVARLTAKIDHCKAMAEAATSDQARAHHLRRAQSYERTRQYYRTFPLGIYLIVVSFVAPLVPVGFLAPIGLGVVGWIAGAGVALVEIWLWQRYRRKRAVPSTSSRANQPRT